MITDITLAAAIKILLATHDPVELQAKGWNVVEMRAIVARADRDSSLVPGHPTNPAAQLTVHAGTRR